jgi:ligand-binding SRPBCC domain-containing protein
MKTYVLEREQWFPKPLSDVFDFFSDAGNLERITPPFLRFRILTPRPIAMGEGALIDYQLKLFGIPFGWRTRIDVFEPNRRFVDRQLRGPYALWRHTHEFEADGPTRTRMVDRVEYALGFGPLGNAAHGLFVSQTLQRIFDYRAETMAHIFGATAPDAKAGGSVHH